MRMSVLAATLAICTATYSPCGGAQADLDEKEMRQLIIGNTVDGENLQGSPFKQFFHRDGGYFTEFAGMVLPGTWTIRLDGALCLMNVANVANPCGITRRSAAGGYERVIDGTLRAKWLKVTSGNSLLSASVLAETVSFKSVTYSVGASSFVIPLAKEGTEAAVSGFLAIPKQTEPVPAVILLHGCSGISGSEIGWAKTLKTLGIATFIVDSFGGRALAQTCSRSESLNIASAMADAYNALELLAANPGIDRTRIAIMGFSLGGLTAVRSSQVRFQERFAKGPTRFAAHLAFYPAGCHIKLADEERIGAAPLRIFHGTADDWTPIGPCKAYVAGLRKAGKDAALIEYADAHHSFDNVGLSLRKLPAAVSPRNCKFVEEEGRIIDAETRSSIFYSSCWLRGVSVGYSADAHRSAMKDVESFLGAVFRLK